MQPKYKPRQLKISYLRDSANHAVPILRLQGKWLEQAGFHPHDHVKVEVSATKLIITKQSDYSEKRAKTQSEIRRLQAQIADLEQTLVK